jgi:uracil-DNA glycosylase family 4
VTKDSLTRIDRDVVGCTACPRLVSWREEAAANPPRRFAGERYWARPAPGFGDPAARLLIVGLAPAAHGANRTGRMFTGDRSGDFLYAALHRAGFANQPTSVSRGDGLALEGARISAVVRCAPPGNVPERDERDRCVAFLRRELAVLEPRVIVALGGFAWTAVLRELKDRAPDVRRPRFGHGALVDLDGLTVIASYHPSQQNTFTGTLTPDMLDTVLAEVRERLGKA